MSHLVVVVPLREGAHERARELLRQGPPFDLEKTQVERHHVFLTEHEAVFVFETSGGAATLELSAEHPAMLQATAAWRECIAAGPRKAQVAYSWERTPAADGPESTAP